MPRLTLRSSVAWLRRFGIFLLPLLLAFASLAGCDATLPFLRPAHGNRLPDAQQILHPLEVGARVGDVETLDPAQILFAADHDKAQLIFPALVTLGDDLRPIPWAAKALPDISADGLTYTFHLRDNLQWSDGKPITADDFAYSINRSLDPCTASDVASYLFGIRGAAAFNATPCPSKAAGKSADTLMGRSIVAADPRTLRLTLEAPRGQFLAELVYPTAFAVPRRLVEAHPTDWTTHLADGEGLGGNLFKLVQWDHQGHLAFARNERFWGTKPLLRRIEYTLYKDPSQLWSDYKQGKGDVGSPPILTFTNGALNTSEHDTARSLAGSSYHEVPQLALSWLQPNWKLAPFDDVRVRKAFALALDRRAIAHEVYGDTALPTIHLIPEGLPEHDPHLADSAGRTEDAALGPDLAAARALASAYAAEKCGEEFAKCPVVGYYWQPHSRPTPARDATLAQWRTAFPGWRFEDQTCDRCPQIFSGRSYPLFKSGWAAHYPDTQDFFSQLWRTGAPYNSASVSVPAADALMDQADASHDQMERATLYRRAEQLLVDAVAAIPLTQSKTAYVVRARVGGGWHLSPLLMPTLPTWQRTYLQD